MAGFLALNRVRTLVRTLALASLLAPSLPAFAATTNAAPEKPAAPSPAPAAKSAVPPLQEDYFQRYGKILAPGTEPAHPLKLAMPFPDVGQINIPSQEQIDMREKLEHLTTMSDADIRQDLEKWPAFAKMSLSDEGNMLVRIQQFKDRRAKIAQDRAHALGLLTLKPDQLEKFEKEYWDKRMQMDRELAKQFEPVFNAHEAQIEEQLYREFSTPGEHVPAPPPPKPPAPPKVAQNSKPPTPSPAPAAAKPTD
jgi:hypothetical protein